MLSALRDWVYPKNYLGPAEQLWSVEDVSSALFSETDRLLAEGSSIFFLLEEAVAFYSN